jgi:hypothetical protein
MKKRTRMEENKQNKERKTFTLKPINIAWLQRRALQESTPEDRKSDSALLDEILDQVRESEPSPTKSKKNARALEAVAA